MNGVVNQLVFFAKEEEGQIFVLQVVWMIDEDVDLKDFTDINVAVFVSSPKRCALWGP